MKWRRRPIVRDVVDAIKLPQGEYLFIGADGKTQQVPEADFERDYEPVLKDRKPKTASTKRKRKGTQPGAAAE